MLWIFVTALWLAMLISPFVLLYLFLPTGRHCPRCANETVPIRSALLRPLRSFASLRWCIGCGWEGVARNAAVHRSLPKFEVVPDGGHLPHSDERLPFSGDADDDAPWRQNA